MLSLADAAKQVGRDKTTLLRAIQKGKISASKTPQDEWQVDPAELFRVYTPAATASVQDAADATIRTPDAASEIIRLQRELEVLNQERERERRQFEDRISDLRGERDRLLSVMEDHAGTVKLLTDQRQEHRNVAEKSEQEHQEQIAALRSEIAALRERPGLLARLFGRSA